jgi:hypothetical protein
VAFALYLDDDSGGKPLTTALLRAAVDVIRATDAGMRGQPDEEHLTYATRVSRVLYSSNRGDFARLHRLWLAEVGPTQASSS